MSDHSVHNADLNNSGIINVDENVPKKAKDSKDSSLKNTQVTGKSEINKKVDCSVVAQGTVFNLDSFDLKSWSGYFRSCFRTDILQKNDTTYRLRDISGRTFQLILDMLNTGDTNLLTEENINDIWHAAHRLQIAVLKKLCSDFILARLSLDNVAMYKRKADSLQSIEVLRGIFKLIIKNFSALSNTKTVINLNTEDLKQIVQSDELSVESEDIVLQAIYTWVNSNEKERIKYLADLLNHTRYCLASNSCIAEMCQHSLTMNDSRVKEIFDTALAFNVDNCYMSGFWPTSAIYRDSMEYDHIGVYCSLRSHSQFTHISLKKNENLNLTDIPNFKARKLAVVNGSLVACSDTNELFTLTNKVWLQVSDFKLEAQDTFLFMLSHESSIFGISRKKLYRCDANDWSSPVQEITQTIATPKHAMSFYNQIFVFNTVNYGGEEQTAVHAWHLDTNAWTKVGALGTFKADGMASFKDDTNAYVLDRFGHLWKLTKSNTPAHTYIGQLWDVNVKLRGALLFGKSLYLFVTDTPKIISLNLQLCLASGVFRDVRFHSTGNASNVVCILKAKQSSTAV